MRITFRGWQRPAVGQHIIGIEGGRAQAALTVHLQGTTADGVATGDQRAFLRFGLAGPGDVEALQPGAIIARFPVPGAVEAEMTKCPYVEFGDPALPWRYTPQGTPLPSNPRFRPWLALVVGTAEEIAIAGATAVLSEAVQAAHPLRDAPTWAHVQEVAGRRTSRVLNRRGLNPGTRYLAVLVPSLVVEDDQVVGAWERPSPGPVTLPCLARWNFRTGPGGDFRTLATGLHPGEADASTGRAAVRYGRFTDSPVLQIGGALAPALDDPDEEPLPDDIARDLDRLRTPEQDADGRPIIGLPLYGSAWHTEPDDTTDWGDRLNRDPRHRGVAGLGMLLGVEFQTELADLLSRQAGAEATVAERVRHLALGLEASGSLWRRRLPADPQRRMWTFGPALRRVVTANGPVDASATAADRPIPRGWFAPVTRRALRPGPARTALARPEAADPQRLNPVANRPPPPVPFKEAGLPPFDTVLQAAEFDDDRLRVIESRLPEAPMLGVIFDGLDMNNWPTRALPLTQLRNLLGTRDPALESAWVPVTLLLRAMAEGEDDPEFDAETADRLTEELLTDFEGQTDAVQDVVDLLRDLGDEAEDEPPSRPLDLARMAGELSSALDPRLPAAPVRQRVLDTVSGVDPEQPLHPPEPCPAIDYPVWRKLAELASDWLLPGVGSLAADSVVAMGTNPVFVDAFLAGLNTRLLEEARWRNLRVASGCTPIRTFWFRVDEADGGRIEDIVGIDNWAAESALGDAQHRPLGVTERDLVLVFRSRLFDRYPHTLLYLVSALHNGVPDFTRGPAPGARHLLPTFQGRIGADVTFFGFAGTRASEVTELWVTLEEPPAGVRFRNDVDVDATDGAAFADEAFDDPVRVRIRGDHVVPGDTP